MDEQALLPGGMLGLSVDVKPLQPTDSQVRGGEGVGTTQGKLHVVDQSGSKWMCLCTRWPGGHASWLAPRQEEGQLCSYTSS